MLSHLGIFVLSHSKRIMNQFVYEIDGIYTNKVNYIDTTSLYTHVEYYEELKEAVCLGNILQQGKTTVVTDVFSMEYFWHQK